MENMFRHPGPGPGDQRGILANLYPEIDPLAGVGWRLYPRVHTRKSIFKGAIQAATAHLTTFESWSSQYSGCSWFVVPKGAGIGAPDVGAPAHSARCVVNCDMPC